MTAGAGEESAAGGDPAVADPDAVIRRLIADRGPIAMAEFMGESNARYYAARDPLGGAGDFITAPEIHQMFGEMVGAWLADLWDRAGRPDARYVELGPGRGTLAADALRVMGRAGFTPPVDFVEGSPALRAEQALRVPAARMHDDPTSLPDNAPLLVVANEFFDALPIRQLVRTPAGWRERMVGLVDGALAPVAGERPIDAALPASLADAEPGAIIETCPGATAIMRDLALRIAAQGGAALVIDYGYDTPRSGSTLQAVSGHRGVDPFTSWARADLTAHVDFSALADAAGAGGCRVSGVAPQGAWLARLGIEARAAALVRANPQQESTIHAALQRLTAPGAMGMLFKVLAIAAPDWPDGAGFAG